MSSNILVVGAGAMAEAYFDVLNAQNANFDVVCRSSVSAERFKKRTGFNPKAGGLDKYLHTSNPVFAIVATGVEHLYETTKLLIKKSVKHILIEKPGALYIDQLDDLKTLSQIHGTKVYIAYNRRFFSSVLKLRTLIEEDGGIQSFSFDFTEWSDRIEPLLKGEGVKEMWVLSNSTHVIDLAFSLGGSPVELSSFVTGEMQWHPSGSCFVGSGKTTSNALFSYRSDWDSQGRWGITVYTNKNSYILCPLESLSRIPRNSVISEKIDLDNQLDISFKPGLFLQVENFLKVDDEFMCSLDEHLNLFSTYKQIAGY